MDISTIQKGDLLKIFQKVIEGKKERLTTFTGRVTAIKGSGDNRMMTLTQTFEGVTVDKIYPMATPVIAKIEKIEEKKVIKHTQKRSKPAAPRSSKKSKTSKSSKSKSSKKS